MADGVALLLLVTAQRLYELSLARRNTLRLVAAGAYEVGRSHYPVIVALHASWLITLWIFGWNRSLVVPFVIIYIVLQAGRVWVLRTLGARWTTRIVIVPGVKPITTGPFRYLQHPNYLVVALELPCVSLALGLWLHAMIFGTLNLVMLAWRIRVEDSALQELRLDPDRQP